MFSTHYTEALGYFKNNMDVKSLIIWILSRCSHKKIISKMSRLFWVLLIEDHWDPCKKRQMRQIIFSLPLKQSSSHVIENLCSKRSYAGQSYNKHIHCRHPLSFSQASLFPHPVRTPSSPNHTHFSTTPRGQRKTHFLKNNKRHPHNIHTTKDISPHNSYTVNKKL